MSILLITGISVSVVFALFAQRSVVGSTECYSCVNSTAASKCSSVVSCKIGEICFADHITTIGGLSISLGCMPEASCSSIVTGNISIGGSLIGRSTSVGDCSECCRQNRCNRQLCQSSSDGSWSSWLEWSHCDVSCGNGTQSRIRKCTEPSPSGGGKDCSGTSKQTVICSAAPCPVHGQWSTWTSWGACSSTCGIGLQRRDRSCSNPYPSPNGDHCFGDSRDDKICMETACAETDGGWSVWSVWTACSTTCNTGLQTRQRQCNNPVPSSGGLYCKGSPMDVVLCNRQHCPRAKSSFQATGATPQSTGILSFSTVKLNEGSYFDGGSGTFTCQLSGRYFFTATIVEGGGTDNIVNCIIRKNAVAEVSFYYHNGVDSDGRRPQNGYGVATGSATLHLTNRDRVNIMCGTDTLSVSLSSFTGFLIAEDP